MKYSFYVRPAILSGLFTNLAAGWFGLAIITPTALVSTTVIQTVGGFIKAIASGIVCLLMAEILVRFEA